MNDPINPGSNFNGLTPAETERLSLLAEECGEVIQAIGKILRHGYASGSPLVCQTEAEPNRADLEKECGHFLYALDRLMFAGDLKGCHDHMVRKSDNIKPYLHHQ